MDEVTDMFIIDKIRQQFPSTLLFRSTEVQLQIIKVWKTEREDWYQFHASVSYQWPINGFIDTHYGHVYLDAVSMVTIIQNIVQIELDMFNAGYHWRYKGL